MKHIIRNIIAVIGIPMASVMTIPVSGADLVYSYNDVHDGYNQHHIHLQNDTSNIVMTPVTGAAWNATFFSKGGLIYSLYKNDECHIYHVTDDGLTHTQLTFGKGLVAFHPMGSADGKYIAFTRYDTKDIAIMKSDGSDLQSIAVHESYDFHPVFFEDGKRLLFGSRRLESDADEPGIFIYDLETKEVTHTGYYGFYARPSHDGTKITFGGVEKAKGEPDIYVAPISVEGKRTRLTNNNFYEGHPTFSPNDESIIYVSRLDQPDDFAREKESDTAGTNEVYQLFLDGRKQKKLSYGGAVAWHPEFRGNKLKD